MNPSPEHEVPSWAIGVPAIVDAMARDVVVIGATVAGLTAARRLASEGFGVTVLDPNPEGASASIGHGVAACAHASTVAGMASAYGKESAHEHVRRNLSGMSEIRRVLAAGGVEHITLPLHDHSLGVSLARELRDVAALIRDAGATVEVQEINEDNRAGAWLASEASAEVTGRVFEAEGGKISIADGWRTTEGVDKGDRWAPAEVGDAMKTLLGKETPAQKVYGT